jgi:putative addiction module component (TIGR02574 family)
MREPVLIETEAMELPEVDRALLANRLIESLSRPPEAIRDAWAKEAKSRSDAYHAGSMKAVDGPKAISELRNRYAQ